MRDRFDIDDNESLSTTEVKKIFIEDKKTLSKFSKNLISSLNEIKDKENEKMKNKIIKKLENIISYCDHEIGINDLTKLYPNFIDDKSIAIFLKELFKILQEENIIKKSENNGAKEKIEDVKEEKDIETKYKSGRKARMDKYSGSKIIRTQIFLDMDDNNKWYEGEVDDKGNPSNGKIFNVDGSVYYEGEVKTTNKGIIPNGKGKIFNGKEVYQEGEFENGVFKQVSGKNNGAKEKKEDVKEERDIETKYKSGRKARMDKYSGSKIIRTQIFLDMDDNNKWYEGEVDDKGNPSNGKIFNVDGSVYYEGEVKTTNKGIIPNGKGKIFNGKEVYQEGEFENGVFKQVSGKNNGAKEKIEDVKEERDIETKYKSGRKARMDKYSGSKIIRTQIFLDMDDNNKLYEGEVDDKGNPSNGKIFNVDGSVYYEGEVKTTNKGIIPNGKGKIFNGKEVYQEGEFENGVFKQVSGKNNGAKEKIEDVKEERKPNYIWQLSGEEGVKDINSNDMFLRSILTPIENEGECSRLTGKDYSFYKGKTKVQIKGENYTFIRKRVGTRSLRYEFYKC